MRFAILLLNCMFSMIIVCCYDVDVWCMLLFGIYGDMLIKHETLKQHFDKCIVYGLFENVARVLS